MFKKRRDKYDFSKGFDEIAVKEKGKEKVSTGGQSKPARDFEVIFELDENIDNLTNENIDNLERIGVEDLDPQKSRSKTLIRRGTKGSKVRRFKQRI